MEGSWSEYFPDTAAEKPAEASLARSERCLLCPKCNARTCRLRTSFTPKNPGRQFYTCPAGNHFFKWADEVKPHEWIEVPYCGGCTAGVCRVKKELHGPNADRIMFMCRVKEGEGSCGYRVWKDELEMLEAGQAEERMNLFESRTENCKKTSSTVTDMVKDIKQRDEGTDPVSSLFEPSDDLPFPDVTSQPMDQLKCLKGKSSIISRRPRKRSCYGDTIGGEGTDPVSPLFEPSDDILFPDVTSQPMDHEVISCKMNQVKCLKGKSNTTSRRPHKRSCYGDTIASGFLISASFLTVSLGLNSMSTRDCWVEDAIRQNLSTELNGWWGRLVFHPTSCMMTCALRSSTSAVSYPLESTFTVQDISVNRSGSITPARNFNLDQHRNPFDSTYEVEDKILVNSSDATITLARSGLLGSKSYRKPLVSQCQRHSAQLSGIALSTVSLNEPSYKPKTRSIMSNAFHQAAECLQNELLIRLETMDVKDHEAMSQAAEATFTALDGLLFDHEDLKKRVNEMIHCALSLVEIEQSMPKNDSYQMLVEHCSSERLRLDEMKCVHDKAVKAVIDGKKRINVLQEEISSTMDLLFQIEAEVSCCEIELKGLELDLAKMSEKKEVLEGKYLITCQELEESQRHHEQKEAEHNAAKAAFNRARALLRG
ncbi:hypothetical protein C2S51_017875 [Perilla frutescens var. frutescens]|nr:hypothetical protein C2S51_017875 [Perilla frutescens var. frutescens]